jgi:predicted nucleotidyltransferase
MLLPVRRLCYTQAARRRRGTPGERICAMKTKAEILKILQTEKPELVRRYGLKRLALFGSYAREDQREDSDVDILVEIEPSIGLRFVELADRIENALGIRTDVVSHRAIKPRYWEVIKEELIDVP